jgi:hypothetical protein
MFVIVFLIFSWRYPKLTLCLWIVCNLACIILTKGNIKCVFKESLNSDNQQNKQLPLASNYWIKMTYADGNQSSVLGQVHKSGGVKSVNRNPTLLDN